METGWIKEIESSEFVFIEERENAFYFRFRNKIIKFNISKEPRKEKPYLHFEATEVDNEDNEKKYHLNEEERLFLNRIFKKVISFFKTKSKDRVRITCGDLGISIYSPFYIYDENWYYHLLETTNEEQLGDEIKTLKEKIDNTINNWEKSNSIVFNGVYKNTIQLFGKEGLMLAELLVKYGIVSFLEKEEYYTKLSIEGDLFEAALSETIYIELITWIGNRDYKIRG